MCVVTDGRKLAGGGIVVRLVGRALGLAANFQDFDIISNCHSPVFRVCVYFLLRAILPLGL